MWKRTDTVKAAGENINNVTLKIPPNTKDIGSYNQKIEGIIAHIH